MTGDCRDKKDEGKHPCLICRDYRKCPLTEKEKEAFEYWQIHWCSQQAFWLLKYAEMIHEGKWPVANTTAPGGMSGKVLTEAAFVKVVLLIAELDYRLAKTGWRGRLLAEQAINREKMMYLDDDAKDALYYISGRSRKDTEFNVWLAMRRYRKYNKVVA
jgi:hypothetical protein